MKPSPIKRKVGYSAHPAADFAHLNEMITDEEYQECKMGQMVVNGSWLLNLNAKHPTLKTGQTTAIFKGRKTRILANRLLGVPDTT
jgi:hypothetical protein